MIPQCDTCGARERNGKCTNDYCPTILLERSVNDAAGGGCLFMAMAAAALKLAVVVWLFYTVWTLAGAQ